MFVDEARAEATVLNIFLLVYGPHMTEDVLVVLTGVVAVAVWYDCVHSELSMFALFYQVCSHGRSHHIGHIGMLFGQVCCEVHLFPPIFLFDELHAWEAKVLADALPLNEVD